jgi:hypothetical protein
MSFPYSLPADTYKGEVHGIKIRWSDPAMGRLESDAGLTGALTYTLKAVSENFAYMLADRLQHNDVVIKYDTL